MHFSFGGVVYPNNSIFYLSAIGEGESALLCVTNKTACCGRPNRFGEWFFPNGSMVPSAGSNWDFFRGRGDKLVRLSRRNDAMSPTGIYQCKVPDASGVLQTLLATIIGPGKHTFRMSPCTVGLVVLCVIFKLRQKNNNNFFWYFSSGCCPTSFSPRITSNVCTSHFFSSYMSTNTTSI